MTAPKNDMKGITILIPDGESYIILGVLRCLSLLRGVRIIVLSENRDTAVRHSRYVTEFIHCAPVATSEEWIERINQFAESRKVDIIMPVYENSSRLLIRHRDMLKNPGCLLLPASLENFETADNKWLLSMHLARHGIPGPLSLSAEMYFKKPELAAKMNFPLLAKKVVGTGGGEGISRFDHFEELKDYFADRVPDATVEIQEYIEGYDLGCNVLCVNGEVLAYTIQQGTVFSGKPFTPQVGLRTIRNDRVYSQVKHLMNSLNWTGVANVDIRYDRGSDQFMVLEINPRFWYTVLASALAGVNFPELYCRTVLGSAFPDAEYREIAYLNDKGLAQSIKRRPGLLLKPMILLKYTPLPFQARDWRMTMAHLFWSLKNRFSRLTQRP